VGGLCGVGGKRNELRNRLLVHLENVNDHASSGRELLVTHVTLEVLGLLVLYQHLLILKLTLTVKAPHHVRLLLLLPHRRTRLIDAHTQHTDNQTQKKTSPPPPPRPPPPPTKLGNKRISPPLTCPKKNSPSPNNKNCREKII